jgi:ABC-type branched-subunit amino acid transport system substrate-binding protein
MSSKSAIGIAAMHLISGPSRGFRGRGGVLPVHRRTGNAPTPASEAAAGPRNGYAAIAHLLALVAASASGACASEATSTATDARAAEGRPNIVDGGDHDSSTRAPLVIGVNLSLTGSLATFGIEQQKAIKVAESVLNAGGGVLDRVVEFKVFDDTTDVATSKAKTEELAALGLPLVIGPTGSPVAPEDAKVLFEKRTVLLSPSASSPAMRDAQPAKDRYFFRTAASHALQAKALALKVFGGIAGSPPCKKASVAYADDGYGKPIFEGFKAQFEKLGGSVVAARPLSPTVVADYTAAVSAVLAPAPECQLLVTFPDVAIKYMTQFKKARPTPTAPRNFVSIGSNGLRNTKGFLEAGRLNPSEPASPTIGEGMVVVNYDLSPKTTEYNAFKNIFTSKYPLKPDQTDLVGYTANAYDCAVLTALAIEEAKSATDTVAIRDALFRVSKGGKIFGPDQIAEAIKAINNGEDVDYSGASGPVDFDDYGDVLADFIIERVEGGKFVAVDNIRTGDLPKD